MTLIDKEADPEIVPGKRDAQAMGLEKWEIGHGNYLTDKWRRIWRGVKRRRTRQTRSEISPMRPKPATGPKRSAIIPAEMGPMM